MLEKLSKSLRNNILVGLLLATPVMLTALIIYFLFTFFTNYLVPRPWLQSEFGFFYRALSILGVLILLFLIGLLVRNVIGRGLYRVMDRVLTRLPIVNTLYVSIRQVSETVFSSKRLLFKEAVIVEFPKVGIYSIGFLTGVVPPLLARNIPGYTEGSEWVMVFVPTTPNPTSGYLFVAPRSSVVPANMSITDAMKAIISVGTVLPGTQLLPNESFMDKVEQWFK